MPRLLPACLAALLLAAPAPSAPLVEKYLLEGKHAEGVKALTKHLADKPTDDEARMGLAVVQLAVAVEGVTKSMYRHGLRSPQLMRTLGVALPNNMKPNPKPEKLTHDGLRKIVQAWVDDLGKVEANLAKVTSTTVKLPLAVGRIKLDVFGNGQPISAVELLALIPGPGGNATAPSPPDKDKPVAARRKAQKEKEGANPAEALKKLVIAFDRGDVHWLRGYCHLLQGVGELILALDTKELFDSTGHLFFAGAEVPHDWLKEEAEDLTKELEKTGRPGTRFIIDAISCIYQMVNLPVKEPARLKKVLTHWEGMVTQGKEMWKHIQDETDDDREWVPSPKQKGVLGVPVNKERVENWLATLEEVDQILKGKKLVPFWRGKKAQGFNLRKVFLSPPKSVDLVRWVQGTAATPYLEKGTITNLADPKTLERLDRTFGGVNFFAFAFWFN